MAKKTKATLDRANDIRLKEKLADSALALLISEEKVSPNECCGVEAEFGYLIDVKNHGLEGLFRVITSNDKRSSYYFAVQGGNLMLVDISGMQFLSSSTYMARYHLGKEMAEFSTITLDGTNRMVENERQI